MDFLNKAANIRSVKGSDRVLRCEETGEQFPIGEVAGALASKFELNKRNVAIKLASAVRAHKKAFDLTWTLAEGTPFSPVKPRGPRVVKEGTSSKKKGRAA